MKSLYALKGASAIAVALFCIPIALAAATDKASPTVTATLPSVDNSAISANLRADPLLSVDMNRGEIVSRLMTQWQGELAAQQRESFKDKLSGLRADRLLAVSLVGTFVGVLEVLDGQEKSDRALATLSALGSRDGRKALGDPDKDLLYTPLSPCRLFDTRPYSSALGQLGGTFAANTRRAIVPAGACAIPGSGVKSLFLSVTTLNNTVNSGGFLAMLAPAAPVTAVVDIFNIGSLWSGSNTIVATGAAGQFDVYVAGANAEVLVDVLGYFAPPSSTGDGLRVIQGGVGPTVINGAASNTATAGSAITVSGGEGNAAAGDYSTIGGGRQNSTATFEATVAGGRLNAATGGASSIGGGYANAASGASSTVSGGVANVASGDHSHVGGGGGALATCTDPVTLVGNRPCGNRAEGNWSMISGGESNLTQGVGSSISGGYSNNASADGSTVIGGGFNVASGQYSAIVGGRANRAEGAYSFAAGRNAGAFDTGVFVWADSMNNPFSQFTPNTFNVRATGGARFVTAIDASGAATRTVAINSNGTLDFGSDTRQNINLWGTQYGIGVQNGTTYFRTDLANPAPGDFGFSWHAGGVHSDAANAPGAGGLELMRLSNNGNLFVRRAVVANVVLNTSDRNVKSLFENVNAKAILAKVAALPISKWVYSADDKKDWHIGPMAQDFRKAFGLGQDDKTIATIDADGIALVAIQGLHQLVNEKDAKIGKLERANEAMKRQLAAIMRKLGM